MTERVEIVRIGELGTSDLESCAENIHRSVSSPETRALLDDRHLWGVIGRHGVSAEVSLERLERARSADPSILTAYILYLYDTDKAVGMASAQPNLALYHQPTFLPPKISRSRFSPSMLSQRYDIAGPNVAGWADKSIEQTTALAGVYEFLSEQYPQTWTIEPTRRAPYMIHTGIMEGGFKPIGQGYFDDEESGKHFVPHSTLYVAGQ
jgi:hypothetical protein